MKKIKEFVPALSGAVVALLTMSCATAKAEAAADDGTALAPYTQRHSVEDFNTVAFVFALALESDTVCGTKHQLEKTATATSASWFFSEAPHEITKSLINSKIRKIDAQVEKRGVSAWCDAYRVNMHNTFGPDFQVD